MKFISFHCYRSINTLVYFILGELLLLLPILVFILLPNFVLFVSAYICITLLYILHVYLVPISLFLIPLEFYLNKNGYTKKRNIVTVSARTQKYIYIATFCIYVGITISAFFLGQTPTEDALRYD